MTIYIYGCYQCKKSFSIKKELDTPFRLCKPCRTAFIKSLGLPPEWSSDDFLCEVNDEKSPKIDDLDSSWLFDLLNKSSKKDE